MPFCSQISSQPLHALPVQVGRPMERSTQSPQVGPCLGGGTLSMSGPMVHMHHRPLVCNQLPPLCSGREQIKPTGLPSHPVGTSKAAADMERQLQPGTPINLPVAKAARLSRPGNGGLRTPSAGRAPVARRRTATRTETGYSYPATSQTKLSTPRASEATADAVHRDRRLHSWRRPMLPR